MYIAIRMPRLPVRRQMNEWKRFSTLFHDKQDPEDYVSLSKPKHINATPSINYSIDDEDDNDMVDTVAIGPSGVEYGGPLRGGIFKEPTRFGDWERKGRCSDF